MSWRRTSLDRWRQRLNFSDQRYSHGVRSSGGGVTRACELCDLELDLVPDTAGRHAAVRLDCPVHGPQLMWTPFGDDASVEHGSFVPGRWSRSGLEKVGFEGFVTFRELKAVKPPQEPGVYIVLRPGDEPPGFLERTVAGSRAGIDQSVPTSLLSAKWVPGAEVIYIGRSERRKNGNALRSRLAEYRRLGEGKDSPHRGGLYIWQLADHDELKVCWKPVPNEEVKGEEARLIAEFVVEYGSRPFANRRD